MAMQLPPETESRVREAADRAGVTIVELLNRTFAPPSNGAHHSNPADPDGTNRASSVAEETPEETCARVQGLLHQWQKDYGLPVPPGGFKTVGELFAEWNEEDAKMTDEEREEERRFWEDYERERPNRPLQI